MRLSHDLLKTRACFDDPNLVSRAGLVPVMGLAERAGLFALAREHVTVSGTAAAFAKVKVGCLVAGMAAGADSIDDMDVLRHGAMSDLFDGVRAPSTLGSFLRAFTWGNVRQLEKVSRLLLAELARRTPLLPGADQLAFIDADSTQRRVYGHKKQGAAFRHTKIQGKTVLVRGLNALAATVSTPDAAPVVAAARLRGGNANTARGAASLITEAVATARDAGPYLPVQGSMERRRRSALSVMGGRREEFDMSVYKVIEVIGTSDTSWEDAAAQAVRTASETIRDLRVAEVVKQDIHLDERGAITYRTKLQLSFKYEHDH